MMEETREIVVGRGTVVSIVNDGRVLAEVVVALHEQGVHITAAAAMIEVVARDTRQYELWVTRDFWPNSPKAVYVRVYESGQ